MVDTSSFKSGYVTLAGRPNVGKSTLLNALLNQKLAIVSPRPQTTRRRVLGILNGEDHQIILLDTPGLMEPRYLLQETMVRAVTASLEEADIITVMIEAPGLTDDDKRVISIASRRRVPLICLINKIDLVPRQTLLPLMEDLGNRSVFEEIIPISALKNDGLERLVAALLKRMPAGQPFYPPDILSDEPERFFVAELIREKIFLFYGEEIPFATTVLIEQFIERPGKKDYILAYIYVERTSQRGILIGKNGRALKKLGSAARQEIEVMLGRPVFLELQVKVGKNWRRDPTMLKRLGY